VNLLAQINFVILAMEKICTAKRLINNFINTKSKCMVVPFTYLVNLNLTD
jgi:hypothetical protein